MSQFADLTGKLAAISGGVTPLGTTFSMRGIENKNRRYTYRLGFYKMYNDLKKNSAFREVMKEHWQKTRKRDMSSKELEAELFKRSKNYAERMVTLLHFDYSAISKSKLM